MRASHINPFINAAKLVFETMLNTRVTVQKPRVKTDDRPTNDVTGIISMSGEAAGSMALSFPMATAIKVVEAFSGMKADPDTDAFTDAIGELANMVAGNAKKYLDNLHIEISVPTVIIGTSHRLGRHLLGPWMVLECNSDLGGFNIEVCVVEVATHAGVGGNQ